MNTPSFRFRLVEELATPHAGAQPLLRFFEPERGISYQRLMAPGVPTCEESLVITEGEGARLLQEYRTLLDARPLLLSGMIRLTGYGFFENDALPVDIRRREALIGHPLGWGADYAEWYSSDHKLEKVFSHPLCGNGWRQSIKSPLGLLPVKAGIMLSMPGHDIFGHWLVDMLPRLEMVRHLPPSLPIYLNHVPDWAWVFIDAMGVARSRIKKHPARFFRVKDAMIPTVPKAGLFLAPDLLKSAAARVSNFVRGAASPIETPRVFLSRARWGLRDRQAEDREIIEAIFARRGFAIVHPETLDFPAQVALMQQARLIAGEDGSALHNAMFAGQGTAIGVLSSPGRDNLLHLGLAQVFGQTCGYFRMSDGVEAGRIDAFIDALDQAAGLDSGRPQPVNKRRKARQSG